MTKCNGINDDRSVRYWLSGRGAGYTEAMARQMFSCGGSIFDYEKRRGGRERERTRDDDEEDRTSTHQGKVSIYLIYIMCILF